jgi:hypothetical protein
MPERHFPSGAAQTRIVSVAGFAGFPGICPTFQTDNLRRHFRVRVSHGQPRSRSRMIHCACVISVLARHLVTAQTK